MDILLQLPQSIHRLLKGIQILSSTPQTH